MFFNHKKKQPLYMKVDISYNDELNGLELHFSEKPSPSIIAEVKTKMGFRYSRAKNLWWAKKTKQRVEFAKKLKETLSGEQIPENVSIEIQPSHASSEENIKHRKFSYVTLWFLDENGKSENEKYVLFEPSKNLAIDIATQFGKNTHGERFDRVDVYPRNYVREARKLLAAGQIIRGTGSSQKSEETETVWVVYSSTGKIDSLQISEQKAKEYIQRRPEFSWDKMSIRQMPTKEVYQLWDKQVAETDSNPLTKKDKLKILTEFGKFHEKRKAEFPEVVIEEHEIPIQFKSWLRANHPELAEQNNSIWEEYEAVQGILNPDPEQPQIPESDYRLFFTRFSAYAKAEVGQITGSASLEAFRKWLEENYANISDADKEGVTAYYADYIEKIKEGSKKIDNLSKGKKLQPYSSIFNKLNKVIPDLEENLKKGFMAGKSTFGEKSALMDLNLDVLSEDEKGRFVIALSHYYRQNGDSVADPDMEIRIDFEKEIAEALTFQNALGFQQVYHEKDGKKLVDTRQKKEQNKFLSGWLTNLINTKHKIVWNEVDVPETANKLTNDVGVYTEETAGANFETIVIPIPQSAKYSATIYLVKDEDSQYRFGLSNRKEFGDASGGSFLPNNTDKAYKTRDYALAVALGDLLIHVTALIQRTDSILNNEEKKNKQLMAAFEAIKSYAIQQDIEPIFQEENQVTETQEKTNFLYRIGQGWTNLDEETIATFQKLIDKHSEKLNLKKEDDEKGKVVSASISSDKDRIGFQVYDDKTMLISSLTPFADTVTYGGSTIPKTKLKKAIQHMVMHPERLGEQQVVENAQIIKDLNAALWQESDNEYPVNQVVIKGIAYNQSRLRELLLVKLNGLPLDVQLDLIQSLSQLFKERRPFSGIGKPSDTLSKSEVKKEKENIRSYVDDIIIDNDLWQLKITDGEASSVDGVMAWLIAQLFESADKLVDKPTKSKEMATTTKKENSYELNVMIEDFIVEKDHEDHLYTEDDKNYIAQYTGGGGLIKQGATGKGILYEYFTPDAIVQKMWGLAIKYGYTNGDVLEPACGIGNFIKYAPPSAKVVGYEINPYSNRIAEILYPQATIYQQPFETLFFAGNVHLKGDYSGDKFDLVIGNPPYGEFSGKWAGMGEKKWTGATEYDQYFITRGLDLLRENGLLIFIVPSSFLSNESKYNKLKEKIAVKADLIDAYRMPQRVFKTTDIGTDIVVFKRKST